MSTWASKRKLRYVLALCSVLFVISFLLFYAVYHTPPTCLDGKKNGDERGVDCGGNCPILCSADVLSPLILWERAFKVTKEVYNLVAYVENPNLFATVTRAPYLFRIYDTDNILIAERTGGTFIPPKKKFAIFEPGIVVGERVPTRVTFEFTGNLTWEKAVPNENPLSVRSSVLSREKEKPRIDADLVNNSLQAISNIEAVAIVFDGEGVAIGASRTFVDYLPKGESASLIYTWPEPFETGVGFCNVPVDAVLVIDRSGSMDDDQLNPPEPLTSVKEAAKIFVNRLEERDVVGLVTFATEASHTPDAPLTNDFESVRESVDSIFIRTDSVQNTNIADGLIKAWNELNSSRARKDSSKIIVLLTDGIATHPTKAGDEEYPRKSTLSAAQEAKEAGTQLFVIGLGDKVNQEFLKTLASVPERYYSAPGSTDVDTIYKKIATALCRKGPAVIEIIPRISPY